jgi:hypothetical protein
MKLVRISNDLLTGRIEYAKMAMGKGIRNHADPIHSLSIHSFPPLGSQWTFIISGSPPVSASANAG